MTTAGKYVMLCPGMRSYRTLPRAPFPVTDSLVQALNHVKTLYLLRKLRSFKVSHELLQIVYKSLVESALKF